MSRDGKNSDPDRNPLMEWLCECLPNCTKAIELVETGIKRDLSPIETIKLKYNSRLCPFCACATGKFDSARARMKEAKEARDSQ